MRQETEMDPSNQSAVPKRSKDVSDIEGKVLSMYARGMSQRISHQRSKIFMVLKYPMK
jgi:hypothetical protein